MWFFDQVATLLTHQEQLLSSGNKYFFILKKSALVSEVFAYFQTFPAHESFLNGVFYF
jgi:hypothetical protein